MIDTVEAGAPGFKVSVIARQSLSRIVTAELRPKKSRKRPLTHGAAFTSWRCPEAAALTPGGRARAAQKFSTAATMAALVSERRSGVPSSSSSCRLTMDPASSSTAGMLVRMQHDQLVVTVHAGLGVDEDAAAMAHQRQGVMRRIIQAAALQFAPEQVAEPQAASGIGIFVRYENRVARIIVR